MQDNRKNYNTKCKSVIAAYLENNSERRVSVSDILNYLEDCGCSANRTTVYRNLEKMSEAGQIIRYKTSDRDSAVYQCVTKHDDCHNHLHLQCEKCGRIIHLECDFMDKIAGHLFEDHGFRIKCEGSVLLGTCRECLALLR
ncbi:MAG: transcriptional repressor [Clostridiales bacterium]|nr:transcriptional repressor [Clostridiales bacterium]